MVAAPQDFIIETNKGVITDVLVSGDIQIDVYTTLVLYNTFSIVFIHPW